MSKLFKKLARRNPGTDFARRFGVTGSERYTGIRPPTERRPGMSGGYQDIPEPGWPGGERPTPARPRGRRGGRSGGDRGGLGPMQR